MQTQDSPGFRLRMVHVVYAGVIYCALVASIQPRRGYDLWWHLATGKQIVESGQLPREDIYTYTRKGEPWIAHEWAWEIVMYRLYHAWGYPGLALLKVTVSIAAAVLLTWLSLRRGARPLSALIVVILTILTAKPLLNVRPQISGILLVTAMLCVIELGRNSGAKWLLLAPVIMIPWVNMHGGFIYGPAVLLVFAACLVPEWWQQRRAGEGLSPPPGWVLGSLVLACLACLVNPNGVAGALYPLKYIAGEHAWHKAVITEYRSPDFSNPLFLFLEVVILLVVLCFAVSRQRARLFDVVLVLAFLHTALKWERNTALFAFVVAPVISQHLTGVLEDFALLKPTRSEPAGREPQVLYGLIILALVVGGVLSVPWALRRADQALAQDTPVECVEVACQRGLHGHMFNTYRWGGYLIWKLWPEHLVFIDGRADVMGKELVEDFRTAEKLDPGWRQVLDKYDVQWVIISPSSPLCRGLRIDPGFQLLHASKEAELFIRYPGVNDQALEPPGAVRRRSPPG